MIHVGFALHLLLLLLLLLLLGNQATATLSHKSLIVCGSNLGCLKGIYMPGYQIKRFEGFLGIPYALPPVDELRFNYPKVMPKLQGIYNASTAKPDCIQKNYLLPTPLIYGEEDCLYLNVYRPEHRSGQPLPVMVYIHGGGFFSGSAGPQLTGPEYFMDTGEVLLVTMAYRLGALDIICFYAAKGKWPYVPGFMKDRVDSASKNFFLQNDSYIKQFCTKWIQVKECFRPIFDKSNDSDVETLDVQKLEGQRCNCDKLVSTESPVPVVYFDKNYIGNVSSETILTTIDFLKSFLPPPTKKHKRKNRVRGRLDEMDIE
ncbi:GH22070 [Drosophila grimshawi]|uniref:carboxylesterase n=1 Tax=Drosophila grimshawi TaxID=7222 RepID=B4J9Y5_DROGR|nr:GH22070 [Drosophila grimshawi]